MLGTLAGAALSIGSAIFGGIKASAAARSAKRATEREREANQSWYDRNYNVDAARTATAQRVLTLTREALRDRNRAAAGTQAVMGGTDESVAATKASGSGALAEAASQITAAGERRRDGIEEQYRERESQLRKELNGIEYGRAQATAGAVEGVAKAAAALAGPVDDWFKGDASAGSANPSAGSGNENKGASNNDMLG